MKTNQDAEKWLIASNLPFWEIRKGEKNVGRSPEPSEGKTLELETSANKFIEISSFLSQGAYSLYAWRFQNGKQAGLEFDFFIGNDQPQQAQAIGSVSNPEIDSLRRELEDMKRKQFEKEVEEKYRRKYAKNSQVDSMGKFTNVIGQIFQMWEGRKTAPATVGNPNPQTEEEQQATAQEIEQALTTLQEKLGTETLTNALKNLASKNEAQLQQLLKFL
jgi:hypothetical protein